MLLRQNALTKRYANADNSLADVPYGASDGACLFFFRLLMEMGAARLFEGVTSHAAKTCMLHRTATTMWHGSNLDPRVAFREEVSYLTLINLFPRQPHMTRQRVSQSREPGKLR